MAPRPLLFIVMRPGWFFGIDTLLIATIIFPIIIIGGFVAYIYIKGRFKRM